ncbi:DUF3592 domain-containing protein [Hymenobacter rigui]|uniref:DUF3592 domain-containing protein n=1 Tax=Hymenobacter rigui TaxID=334424 RepID=A0A428KP99_9BACT|nr:DUF3592 domain-containing protein [Hymenobacter rigui]RSK48297.1 DUF3592 domain-containing protein [Hymenobacter rigui]
MALILITAAGIATAFLLNYLSRRAETQRRQLFQERGIATQARITRAECFTTGGRTIAYFCNLTLQYYDEQSILHTVDLRVPDSPDAFLYLVGDELPIWYNPRNPTDVELVASPPQNVRQRSWFSGD